MCMYNWSLHLLTLKCTLFSLYFYLLPLILRRVCVYMLMSLVSSVMIFSLTHTFICTFIIHLFDNSLHFILFSLEITQVFIHIECSLLETYNLFFILFAQHHCLLIMFTLVHHSMNMVEILLHHIYFS